MIMIIMIAVIEKWLKFITIHKIFYELKIISNKKKLNLKDDRKIFFLLFIFLVKIPCKK